MTEAVSLKYLAGYGPSVVTQVEAMVAAGRLGDYLQNRYPQAHGVRNDKALFQAALDLKQRYLRNSAPLTKVVYDSKLQLLSHALGTHTTVARVQGHRLKASREIRVAAVFKDAPADFLRMILVHELAHLKESEHNRAFYQLCTHMAPDYHQLEFDLRLYLTFLETGAAKPWCARGDAVPQDSLKTPSEAP